MWERHKTNGMNYRHNCYAYIMLLVWKTLKFHLQNLLSKVVFNQWSWKHPKIVYHICGFFISGFCRFCWKGRASFERLYFNACCWIVCPLGGLPEFATFGHKRRESWERMYSKVHNTETQGCMWIQCTVRGGNIPYIQHQRDARDTHSWLLVGGMSRELETGLHYKELHFFSNSRAI